jgi:hypothetical protein
MDPEYKKMMTWLLVALVASLLISVIVVEWTIRHYAAAP